MTLAEFIDKMVTDVINGEPQKLHQRVGQYAYNQLHEANPTLARAINATEFDPFYQNSILPKFYEKLKQDW